MTLENTIKIAKDAKCFGLAQNLESRLLWARKENASYEDLIRALIEDELADQKSKKASRLVARARSRHGYDLEDWDSTFDRGISKLVLKDLALLTFYKHRENLLILGQTG